MKYLPSKNTKARSIDYRGSVTCKDDKDLLELKNTVSAHNSTIREMSRRLNQFHPLSQILRVSLMSRGHRTDKTGNLLHGNARQSLRHEYATHWDVYVQNDGRGKEELKREIETGMTPGELRKYDNLRHQIQQLELNGFMRKRQRTEGHGI